MKSSLEPTNKYKCPSETDSIITVSQTGDAGRKTLYHKFTEAMPAADGESWHCHMLISIDDVNLPRAPNADAGYLYLIPEQFCFGKWVKVIV